MSTLALRKGACHRVKIPHRTIHVCRKEEKADGEGQEKTKRVQQARTNGEWGASRKITEGVSSLPEKEMQIGTEGVLSPRRAVYLDSSQQFFQSHLSHPSLIYFLPYLEHQSGPGQDTGDKMRYKIQASALGRWQSMRVG